MLRTLVIVQRAPDARKAGMRAELAGKGTNVFLHTDELVEWLTEHRFDHSVVAYELPTGGEDELVQLA